MDSPVQSKDSRCQEKIKKIDFLCMQYPVKFTSYVIDHDSLPPFFSSI